MTDRPSHPATELREWNAASYHRVANPHVDWGRVVLERLPLTGDETVIDAGCGTGRLTELLLDRLPNGHVVALDRNAKILGRRVAVFALAGRLQPDLAELVENIISP